MSGQFAVALLLCTFASAEDRFALRLVENRPYRVGEAIPVEIAYPVRDTSAPPDFWQFAGVLVSPSVGCGTEDTPCGITTARPPDGVAALLRGHRSGTMQVNLNSYLPRLTPGRYEIAVRARRVVRTREQPGFYHYDSLKPPQYGRTNAVSVTVMQATDDWIKATIAEAAAVLRESPDYDKRRSAAEQLTFLDDPRAWSAALRLPRQLDDVVFGAMWDNPRPQVLCGLLQAALPRPEQAVTSSYLSAMAHVCMEPAIAPPLPSYTPPSAEQIRYWEERRRRNEELLEEGFAALAAALKHKTAEQRQVALNTLLERLGHLRLNVPLAAAPTWYPAVKAEFLALFPTMEDSRKQSLLSSAVVFLPAEELLSLLERVLELWRPSDYGFDVPRSAIRLLHAIDRSRAQTRIRTELRRTKTWLSEPDLAMLPPEAARFPDDELIEALAAAQRAGGWNTELRMAAIAKYASPGAADRVRRIYESHADPCQPELLAYFVRVDPAYADRVFRSHAWDMQAAPPPCTMRTFEATSPLAMSAPLENYLSAYLMHRSVQVKATAARMLRQYGTPAALPALWNAYRYFHDYWKGKPEALAANLEGAALEMELRDAMAHGRGWLLTTTSLREVRELCTLHRCISASEHDLEAATQPLRIDIEWAGDVPRFAVAQYTNLSSEDDLRRKLAQYPRGTRFTIVSRGGPADAAAARVRQFATRHGLLLE